MSERTPSVPGSVRENDADVRAFVTEHGIRTALDVGPGRGTYSRILSDLIPVMDAVEVWRPYIGRYQLYDKYRTVTLGDVRDHGKFDYDLVIFGDVLEHMPREDALAVWTRAGGSARFTLMSVPIICYPQGALKGNPHEVHVQEHLTPDDVRRDYGPFVLDRAYEITGTFIRQWR
jgi:hypothetical protein